MKLRQWLTLIAAVLITALEVFVFTAASTPANADGTTIDTTLPAA